MTLLSLAKGDPAARTLIGNAVKARYGLRPIPLSSLDLQMTAPARGPLGLPARQTTHIRLVGVTHWRCDQWQTVLGLSLARRTESYDGATYYVRSGSKKTDGSDSAALDSVRQQAWLWLSLFLTPLTEEGVTLKAVDASILQANPAANAPERARLTFNPDFTLVATEAEWQRGGKETATRLSLRPAGELRLFGDFPMPSALAITWDGAAEQLMTVTQVAVNTKIPLTEFTLG